jgi:hypothetical protein
MERDTPIPPLDRVGANLDSAIARADARKPRRRMRPVLVAGGVTAVVAVLAFLMVGRPGGGKAFTVQDAVAAVARAAYDQPQVQPSGVVYTKVLLTSASSVDSNGHFRYFYPARNVRETWYRAGDKKGWIRSTIERPTDKTVPARTATCRTIFASIRINRDLSQSLHLPPGTKIPTDPSAAYRLLKRHVPPGYIGTGGDDSVVWMSIGYLMEGGAPRLTQAQRAALVGALGKVPGVTTTGPTTDPVGNPAIGFTRIDSGVRERIYFDSRTSLASYAEDVVTKPLPRRRGGSIPVGTVLWSRALLDFRYVSDFPSLKNSPLSTPNYLLDECPELRHRAAVRRLHNRG